MHIAVTDNSQVAQARRNANTYATRAGVPDARIGAVAIVVTELATNLLKHGGGGDILIGQFSDADGVGVEVLALDRGAGMTDVGRCMQDGYSSAGSLGHGLGAAARQSDHLRIWSRPGMGTVVAARFVLQSTGPGQKLQCGAASTPYPGEKVCGDAWASRPEPNGVSLLLADGAGHGMEAEKAAQLATREFQKQCNETSEDIVRRLHHALMPTRGAALAVAHLDTDASLVRYVGVGNIAGAVIAAGRVSHMVSHNGTAGHVAPRIREFTYALPGSALVILHSDGVTSRWDLNAYPGLITQHPSLVAGVLLRDFRRGRDDASVVAARLLR